MLTACRATIGCTRSARAPAEAGERRELQKRPISAGARGTRATARAEARRARDDVWHGQARCGQTSRTKVGELSQRIGNLVKN
jgi:hypothetical protein